MKDSKRQRIEKYAAKGRRYKILAYNRFLITTLLVLLELAVYVLLLFYLDAKSSWVVQIVERTLALICVVHLIMRTDRLYSKTHWIVLLLLLPLVGMGCYFIFGDGRPTRRMNRKICLEKEKNMPLLAQSEKTVEKVLDGGRQSAPCKYLYEKAGYPAYLGGTVSYYKTGEELFQEMLKEAEKAKKYILVEYFIFAGGKMWDTLRSLLLKKAEEGVKVYISYDDFGSIMYLPYGYEKYVEELHENIRCKVFNRVVPFLAGWQNNRDHRKIFVVDGKVAFTGGINIADEYIGEKRRFGYWKDTGLKITGASVKSFCVMFANLWNAFEKEKIDVQELLADCVAEEENCNTLVQPYDDSPLDTLYTGASVYIDMITSAAEYVYVFTPYLVLDDMLRSAFCAAAARGVDVRIVTPGIPDKKMVYRVTQANYDALLKAGVKIYEYTPGFIHAKSMVCDGKHAVVGSINCDYRSLYHHFENAVYFTDEKAIEELRKDCEETIAISRPVTKENFRRSVFRRLVDAVLRLFEPML